MPSRRRRRLARSKRAGGYLAPSLVPRGDELCVILTPKAPMKRDIAELYVEGLINLSDSLRVAERRPHVTFVSSTSVFGDADHPINESHVPNPKALAAVSFTGRAVFSTAGFSNYGGALCWHLRPHSHALFG